MFQEITAPAGPDDRYAGVRALWAKVIIRAVFDWVTYRDSLKLQQRKLADNAEAWLFQPNELFNGFENVCKFLDVCPNMIRARARTMTKENVFKIEHRERDGKSIDEESEEEGTLSLPSGDVADAEGF